MTSKPPEGFVLSACGKYVLGVDYETLEAESERLRGHQENVESLLAEAERRAEDLQAENERLREALRKIERGTYDGLEVMPLSYTDSRAIARAALGKGGSDD